MKKLVMLLLPVVCISLLSFGCAPPEQKKPADKGAPTVKEPAKDAPAPAKEEKK
jgi:hypothetical protein